MSRAMIVCAHPDDEALGCGGTIARLSAEGMEVHILFLADGVNSRSDGSAGEDAVDRRRRCGDDAAKILNALPPTYLDFPDNRLDGVDLLDVVAGIERVAKTVKPELVLTHFPGDLNVDHRICAQAVMTAFRPMPESPVKAIYGFEVLSSTEWAFGVAGQQFSPNIFFDVSAFMPLKIAALDAYGIEMRAFPHPRSKEAVQALAAYRGASAGCAAAEAFSLLRMVI